MSREPSPHLRLGRRALEGLSGLELLGDLTWYEPGEVWAVHVRLTHTGPESDHAPRSSDWFLTVEDEYPWGDVKVYPAKTGGITATFQHQDYNWVGDLALPWRSGNPCVGTPLWSLGRHGHDPEPFTPAARLRWHARRVVEWLAAAAAGMLASPGEPFELPKYFGAISSPNSVAFNEGPLPDEAAQMPEMGFVQLRYSRFAEGALLIDRLVSRGGNLLRVTAWGPDAFHPDKGAVTGAFIRLPGPPVLEPWQGPLTWNEVRAALLRVGVNMDVALMRLFRRLRTGKHHPLLFVFPVPERVGGPAVRLHWQAALLPELSTGKMTMRGFRPNTLGYYCQDRRGPIANDEPIAWMRTESWSSEDLSARGQLRRPLREMKAAVIGCGALGSAVAELLARAGVKRLLLADTDKLAAGNLVRHTLTQSALNSPKADAVRERLIAFSPHAVVTTLGVDFPPVSDEARTALADCELVIECTGEDATLASLERFPWSGQRWFASLSLGLAARRVFCFVQHSQGFRHAEYREAVTPWLLREREEGKDIEFPWESIGCWHPVFPARADDVWLMACAAVKRIEAALSRRVPEDGVKPLTVYEQVEENDSFAGLRVATLGGRE